MRKIIPIFVLLILQVLILPSGLSADTYGYDYLEDQGPFILDQPSVVLGGNLTNFTSLIDTPAAYTGGATNCVKVNAGETGLEFGSCATGGGSNLSDVVFYNETGVAGNNITLGAKGWFFGLFDWFTNSVYLAFNGSTLTLDDASLNSDFNQTDMVNSVNTTTNIRALGSIINNTDGWTANFTRIQSDAYQTDQGTFIFNIYDDGSEGFLNASSIIDAFGIEVENSKLILYNEPSAGNDYKVLETFSKQAADVTEFVVTKAGDGHASYFVRSLAVVGNSTTIATPFNCTTYAKYVDCRTDLTGADFYVIDDIETNGTIYVQEAVRANDWTNVTITESQISDLTTTGNNTWLIRNGSNANNPDFGDNNFTVNGTVNATSDVHVQNMFMWQNATFQICDPVSCTSNTLGWTNGLGTVTLTPSFLPETGLAKMALPSEAGTLTALEVSNNWQATQIFANDPLSINLANKIVHFLNVRTFLSFPEPNKFNITVNSNETFAVDNTVGTGITNISNGIINLNGMVRADNECGIPFFTVAQERNVIASNTGWNLGNGMNSRGVGHPCNGTVTALSVYKFGTAGTALNISIRKNGAIVDTDCWLGVPTTSNVVNTTTCTLSFEQGDQIGIFGEIESGAWTNGVGFMTGRYGNA